MSDPVILKRELVKTEAGHHLQVTTAHEQTTLTEDQHAAYDLWAATRAYALLSRVYSGYPWKVSFDSKQGIVDISIPMLMGFNNAYRIRLAELTVGKMIAGAGELLERYRLSRSRFNVGEFLDARQKHSALVMPWSKVPE